MANTFGVCAPLRPALHQLAASKAGYTVESIEPGVRIYMRRDNRSPAERLRELAHFAANVSCLTDPSRDVVRLYEQIGQEMENLARTEEEREKYRSYMKGEITFEEQRISNVRSRP